jgi:hypothetical protein
MQHVRRCCRTDSPAIRHTGGKTGYAFFISGFAFAKMVEKLSVLPLRYLVKCLWIHLILEGRNGQQSLDHIGKYGAWPPKSHVSAEKHGS